MATYDQLPASAKRLFKPGLMVGVDGINTPGQNATATETWQCLMTDRTAFLNTCIGTLEVVGGFSGALVRRVPLKFSDYPALFCTSARSRGKGWDSTATSAAHPVGYWKYCDVEVNYSTFPFASSGQMAFMSFASNPSTRQIAGPASNFRLNGVAPIFDPGDDVQGQDFTLTTHQLPTLPEATYDAVSNCVNSTPFVMPSGAARAVGTVLYHGPQTSTTANADGSVNYEVAHSFSYSKVPWSQYYSGGTLYTMYRPDGTTPKFALADLTTVFSA